jgi:hypothetical protein
MTPGWDCADSVGRLTQTTASSAADTIAALMVIAADCDTGAGNLRVQIA